MLNVKRNRKSNKKTCNKCKFTRCLLKSQCSAAKCCVYVTRDAHMFCAFFRYESRSHNNTNIYMRLNVSKTQHSKTQTHNLKCWLACIARGNNTTTCQWIRISSEHNFSVVGLSQFVAIKKQCFAVNKQHTKHGKYFWNYVCIWFFSGIWTTALHVLYTVSVAQWEMRISFYWFWWRRGVMRGVCSIIMLSSTICAPLFRIPPLWPA